MVIYELELNKCTLVSKYELTEFKEIKELLKIVNGLSDISPISALIAVIKNGVDFGNFIMYLNSQNQAYVIVNEHRGFLVAEKGKPSDQLIEFIDEKGEVFSIPLQETMSFERALFCLESWLPMQEHSEEFLWLDN